jgi:predicted ATPase
VAEAEGDSDRLLQAHHSLWATLGSTGEALRAAQHCDRGLALYDPVRHASQAFAYGGHDPAPAAGNHLARARWCLGYPERAASAIRDALALSDKLAHPLTTGLSLTTSAFIRYQMGDYNAAREAAERTLALARRTSSRPGLTIAASCWPLSRPASKATTGRSSSSASSYPHAGRSPRIGE